MNAVIRIIACIGFALAALPVPGADTDAPVPSSLLASSAPGDIAELYLSFHEKELCGDLNALFLYGKNGLQVWCRARDGGSYDRLMRLIRPLLTKYSVETYSSTLYPDESPENANRLPPSLWENSKLRDYLLSPLAMTPLGEAFDVPIFLGSPEDLYRSRLRLFSDETLKRGSEIERIGAELPELTRMGTGHSLEAELESLAVRICIEHCRELDKQAGKLQKSLKEALPGDGKDVDAGSARPVPEGECEIQDLADRIYENSRQIFQSVHAFLYPEQHTVKLEELRRPGILVSLEELRALQGEYLKRMTRLSAGD